MMDMLLYAMCSQLQSNQTPEYEVVLGIIWMSFSTALLLRPRLLLFPAADSLVFRKGLKV